MSHLAGRSRNTLASASVSLLERRAIVDRWVQLGLLSGSWQDGMINQVRILRNGVFSLLLQGGRKVGLGAIDQIRRILADPVEFRGRWQGVFRSRPYRGNPFAPKVSYGRHRGPAPRTSHSAAVLMVLLPQGDPSSVHATWSIPLTLRPASMSEHAGQVSFPGGRCESGETPQQTACREYKEELGCSSDCIELIGSMPELYVFASRHRVVPMLGVGSEVPQMFPNAQEVDKVLWLPLEKLLELRPKARVIYRSGMQVETLGFWLDGHWVWGATAIMLGELKLRLEQISHPIVDDFSEIINERLGVARNGENTTIE